MAFNLNEFRNKLVNGGARPSQFEMSVIWPDLVRGLAGVAQAEQDVRFLCEISQIPGEMINPITVNYFGRQLKYAGERTWNDLTITILNDEDFKIHKALEKWMKAVADHPTTVSQFDGGIASGSYATDFVVTQMSRNSGGSPTQAYKFIGAWPTNIGDIALNWGSTDAIETFTCTFAYQWWEAVDPSTGATL